MDTHNITSYNLNTVEHSQSAECTPNTLEFPISSKQQQKNGRTSHANEILISFCLNWVNFGLHCKRLSLWSADVKRISSVVLEKPKNQKKNRNCTKWIVDEIVVRYIVDAHRHSTCKVNMYTLYFRIVWFPIR